MTAQVAETLLLEGQPNRLCTEPLETYFEMGGSKPKFVWECTANWRSYVGTWEIRQDRLYLMAISARLPGNRDATLEDIFPGYPARVFAHWYTGRLRVTKGKRLGYVHGGYLSVYERDLFIDVQKGVVTGQEEVVNGQSDEVDPDSPYQVQPMISFPVKGGQKK